MSLAPHFQFYHDVSVIITHGTHTVTFNVDGTCWVLMGDVDLHRYVGLSVTTTCSVGEGRALWDYWIGRGFQRNVGLDKVATNKAKEGDAYIETTTKKSMLQKLAKQMGMTV